MSNVVPFEITQSAPVLYERAKQALAECYQIDEVITWRDKAAALKEYARQRDDEELLKLAHKIHGRAVARVGELLAAVEPATGKHWENKREGTHPSTSRQQAAADAGLTEHQAKQALRMANVPEETREEMLEERVPINQIADLGRTQKQTPAKSQPLFDLKGLDAEQYKRGTQLYGLMEYMVQHLQAIKDPVRAFREGMHPNDQQRFIAMTSNMLSLLEALDHEIR